MTAQRPATLGELRASGWRSRTVKEELRANLIRRLATGEPVLPGVVGYEDSVVPAIENAILAGQDIVFLGERGQAKTRMARALVQLLDPWLPIIRGGELNDDPYTPVSPAGRAVVEQHGDGTPIDWLPRDRRYAEKLATPDITIADLIGEVDPIKVAEGRYLADELTIHYGLLPRTHRGIFVLNELPDLAERIQVGLLNIMEERDVQIRGYLVRLPLDLLVVASANPEDYTNRGRIITPLKDRFGSQVRTHYPRTLAHEITIVEQEATRFASDGYRVEVPAYMQEIVAELTHLARRSSEVSQRSGVSVRVSITNYENLVSNALRRAVRLREAVAVPRVSDLGATLASTAGKIELEAAGDGDEGKVVERLTQKAVLTVFNRHFQAAQFGELLEAFGRGLTWEVGEAMPAADYEREAGRASGFSAAMTRLAAAGHPARVAAAVEFVLEGLHLNRKLNKDRAAGGPRYRA